MFAHRSPVRRTSIFYSQSPLEDNDTALGPQRTPRGRSRQPVYELPANRKMSLDFLCDGPVASGSQERAGSTPGPSRVERSAEPRTPEECAASVLVNMRSGTPPKQVFKAATPPKDRVKRMRSLGLIPTRPRYVTPVKDEPMSPAVPVALPQPTMMPTPPLSPVPMASPLLPPAEIRVAEPAMDDPMDLDSDSESEAEMPLSRVARPSRVRSMELSPGRTVRNSTPGVSNVSAKPESPEPSLRNRPSTEGLMEMVLDQGIKPEFLTRSPRSSMSISPAPEARRSVSPAVLEHSVEDGSTTPSTAEPITSASPSVQAAANNGLTIDTNTTAIAAPQCTTPTRVSSSPVPTTPELSDRGISPSTASEADTPASPAPTLPASPVTPTSASGMPPLRPGQSRKRVPQSKPKLKGWTGYVLSESPPREERLVRNVHEFDYRTTRSGKEFA